MEHSRHVPHVGPLASLMLAAAGAVLLGSGAAGLRLPLDESWFVLLWLIGWALLGWALILALGSVAVMVRRTPQGRTSTAADVMVLSASMALLVLAVSTNPLWGSGSGHGA